MKKKLLVLGCTGSIGQSTLKIVDEFPDLFEITGLSAHSNSDKLIKLGKKYNCKNLCLTSNNSINNEISFTGLNSVNEFIIKSKANIAVNGIAGAPGLNFSILVLQNGIDLALANKDCQNFLP